MDVCGCVDVCRCVWLRVNVCGCRSMCVVVCGIDARRAADSSCGFLWFLCGVVLVVALLVSYTDIGNGASGFGVVWLFVIVIMVVLLVVLQVVLSEMVLAVMVLVVLV